jgi:hypothetical protein
MCEGTAGSSKVVIELVAGLTFRIVTFGPFPHFLPPILPSDYSSINYYPNFQRKLSSFSHHFICDLGLAICERRLGISTTMSTVPDAWDDDWEKLADV